jgi:hypothetical protein
MLGPDLMSPSPLSAEPRGVALAAATDPVVDEQRSHFSGRQEDGHRAPGAST